MAWQKVMRFSARSKSCQVEEVKTPPPRILQGNKVHKGIKKKLLVEATMTKNCN